MLSITPITHHLAASMVSSFFSKDARSDVHHFLSSEDSAFFLPRAVYHFTNQIISSVQDSHNPPQTPH